MNPVRFLWLLLLLPTAQAQNTLTLVQALSQAYRQGPTLQSAQATLQNATLQLNALKADPSTLIVALTQAEQNARLAQVNLEATRLSVMQSVVNAYLSLYEAQQNVALYQAQVALNQRNLEVARARLAAGNATALDVARAQTTLDSSRQSLTTAQAQLPVLAAQLAALLGLSDLGNVAVAPPPSTPALQADLEALRKNLFERLPSVLQAQQAVELAQLNVKLADNDYTPAVQLNSARLNLENNLRALQTAQQNALTSLQNAYQAAQSAHKNIALAQANVTNAQKLVEQSQAALRAGTISALQLQTDQVSLKSAEYALVQAVSAYWKALAALSVAAGQDFTGLVQAASAP
ncbi:MAG: TolC family protein [Meiothermus sp.]|uniref:TolC family protein n=1 Tax=Meiothermus sp. TaxID=1955249 RepID=UPI0025EC2706|nr:TolC family protein [Meiothermus sp.]MCS7058080.1 TolC family protein [Meiothermus sp.]MCS7194045.1 TolC family protein [Meiothermus sp.]MCX7740295.1 TolC family protein [Meiothermus sp.]MDW8091179.1 TolC family protein [Meiothermus sp.]MDW8480444.1 TolC family protein [Meiothermus sp.]